MKLSDSTSISLPARNLLAILAAVAIGTMSYFSVIERLNKIETTLQLMDKDLEAAKMIGAGLAAIALAGAGVGIGIIFGNYLSGAMRNPSAAQKQFPNLLLGFALAEATGLFGLVVALIILFAF